MSVALSFNYIRLYICPNSFILIQIIFRRRGTNVEVYVVLLVRILDCISFIMLLPVSGIELERI